MICQMPPFWWMVIYQPGSARELVSRQRWPRCRVSYPVAVHKMLFAHFNCETPAPFPGHPFVCDTASLSSVCCGGGREDASPLPFAPPPGSILLLLRLFHLSPPALLCVFIVTSKWPSPPCSLQNPHPSFFSQDQWETQRRGKLMAHYFPDSSIIPVMLSTFPWTIGIQVRKKKNNNNKKKTSMQMLRLIFFMLDIKAVVEGRKSERNPLQIAFVNENLHISVRVCIGVCTVVSPLPDMWGGGRFVLSHPTPSWQEWVQHWEGMIIIIIIIKKIKRQEAILHGLFTARGLFIARALRREDQRLTKNGERKHWRTSAW